MKICSNCGAQLPDDAAFCNNCGSSLATNDNVQASDNKVDPSAANIPPQPQPQPQGFGGPAPAPFQQQGQPQFQGQPQAQYQSYANYDPKDHTAEFDAQDIADHKLLAVAAYLFTPLGALLIGIYCKDSAFIKFHIKNKISIFLATVLTMLLFIIPFLGWAVGGVLLVILEVVEIIEIVWTWQGKAKEVPIISSIGFLK